MPASFTNNKSVVLPKSSLAIDLVHNMFRNDDVHVRHMLDAAREDVGFVERRQMLYELLYSLDILLEMRLSSVAEYP